MTDRAEIDHALTELVGQWIVAEAGAVADWRLHPFAIDQRLIGCLAWHGAPRRVRAFAWAP